MSLQMWQGLDQAGGQQFDETSTPLTLAELTSQPDGLWTFDGTEVTLNQPGNYTVVGQLGAFAVTAASDYTVSDGFKVTLGLDDGQGGGFADIVGSLGAASPWGEKAGSVVTTAAVTVMTYGLIDAPVAGYKVRLHAQGYTTGSQVTWQTFPGTSSLLVVQQKSLAVEARVVSASAMLGSGAGAIMSAGLLDFTAQQVPTYWTGNPLQDAVTIMWDFMQSGGPGMDSARAKSILYRAIGDLVLYAAESGAPISDPRVST